MKFFRTLTAEVPGELLAAQVAATSHHTEPTTGPDSWVPLPECPEIWAALATLADHPGVLTPDTPGLPAPANTQETS